MNSKFKAQSISQNYIELNLTKPEVLLTKNKLAFIKYKYLFVVIQIEIYEDKNYWLCH